MTAAGTALCRIAPGLVPPRSRELSADTLGRGFRRAGSGNFYDGEWRPYALLLAINVALIPSD